MTPYSTVQRAWAMRQVEDEEAAKKFKAGLGRSHLDKNKPITPYEAGQFSAQRDVEQRRKAKEEAEGFRNAQWAMSQNKGFSRR